MTLAPDALEISDFGCLFRMYIIRLTVLPYEIFRTILLGKCSGNARVFARVSRALEKREFFPSNFIDSRPRERHKVARKYFERAREKCSGNFEKDGHLLIKLSNTNNKMSNFGEEDDEVNEMSFQDDLQEFATDSERIIIQSGPDDIDKMLAGSEEGKAALLFVNNGADLINFLQKIVVSGLFQTQIT